MPRLLRRERAAAYLDISPNTFDKLVRDGLISGPKTAAGFKWWDRNDLDRFADEMPQLGEAMPDTTWDD